jgi:hypothetical protein
MGPSTYAAFIHLKCEQWYITIRHMVRRKKIKVGVPQTMEPSVFSDHKVSLRAARNALQTKKQAAHARSLQATQAYTQAINEAAPHPALLSLWRKAQDDYDDYTRVAQKRKAAHENYRKRVRVTRRATKTLFPIP